ALARQVAEVGGVAGGGDQRDPRHRSGLADVGDAKARMRMGGAQSHPGQRAGGGVGGGVGAPPPDESNGLLAHWGRAETEFYRWHGRVYSAGAGGASGARRRRRVFSAIQRQTT